MRPAAPTMRASRRGGRGPLVRGSAILPTGRVQPGIADPWLERPEAVTMEIVHKKELADFLRRRRETLQPGDVGLVPGPRRRTGGLRREEVAALAGMSTDYYTRLEQQRGPQPSIQIATALARALRLTLDERDHLFGLIGHNAPARFHHSEHVSPTLLRVLDRLRRQPRPGAVRPGRRPGAEPALGRLDAGPDPPHRPRPQRLLPLVHRPGRTPLLSRRRPPAPRPHPCGPPARGADDRQRHPHEPPGSSPNSRNAAPSSSASGNGRRSPSAMTTTRPSSIPNSAGSTSTASSCTPRTAPKPSSC